MSSRLLSNRILCAFAWGLIFVASFSLSLPAGAQIYPTSSSPSGYYYYPLPQDTVGPMWPADVYKYYQAQLLRTDSIRPSLTSDMKWGLDSMLARQVPGFGFRPTTACAPKLRQILAGGWSNFSAVSGFKSRVKRVRPCRRFREQTFGVESAFAADFQPGNSSEFSFPSAHSACSWGVAMMLLGVNPWRADTIVNRGVAHGQSRVIGGVHWQSDVDAGKVLATAYYARMFAVDDFLPKFDQAKREVRDTLGHDAHPSFEQLYSCDDTLSRLTLSQPGPYALLSPVGSSEMQQSVLQASLRTTLQVAAARQQVDLATDAVLRRFSGILGETITVESKPATYALVDAHLRLCRKMCTLMGQRHERKPRPVEVFGVQPPTGEDVDSLLETQSYPSLHSAIGWTAAMTLMIVKPSLQRSLLQEGIAYGENRVAMGTTWQSDVDMGRIVASIAFGYTTSCAEYAEMVRAARAEF